MALPAWALGRDPTRRIVCVSYTDELADKHARDCRQVMESAWYQRTFPQTRLSSTKNSITEFVTTAGGYRLSTSTTGTLTGRGGNLIIIDDPIKPDDAMSATKRQAVNEWYGTTLYSRLDNKQTDAIIIVMQRLHPEDLVAHVKGLAQWEHLNLPAISDEPAEVEISDTEVYQRAAGEVLHPERESLEELEVTRRSLGNAAFSAQYLQQPLPPGSALVKWQWFRRYRAPFTVRPGDTIVMSWDPALHPHSEGSYSACLTWAIWGDRYFLIDVWRERVDYPTLRKHFLASLDRWPYAHVIMEETAHGAALYQEVQYLSRKGDARIDMTRIRSCRPVTDKASRLQIQSAKIERGQAYLPDQAPWLAAFKEELLHFPHGRHDDQVDCLSQFLYRLDFYPFCSS